MERTYFCIDLKTFYASVECVIRNLNPFSTNLIVADKSRGQGAITLAVSPCLKEQGVRNRCRVFEIPKDIKYITAKPRMSLYIKYAAEIYGIYLKFVAKEDIHVYSIDEVFIDVTHYLRMYGLSKEDLAKKIMKEVYEQTGITATCGIGSNLFLAKVALDILSKHNKDNLGVLTEDLFKEKLWRHRPLTDFWQIGHGIAKKLETHGMYYLEDVAKEDPKVLYKLFGVNAEYLIDHANGKEPCTIKQIKEYKPQGSSLSSGQVLFEDYSFSEARLVVKEMVELLTLELTSKNLVCSNVSLGIGYSKDSIKSTGGSISITNTTNSFKLLLPYFLEIYDKTTNPKYKIRKINVTCSSLMDEAYAYYDLFTDEEEVKKDVKLQKTIVEIKNKYGKNAILRGMNLEKKATTLKRNKLIGGHNSE
jgi:DNA polymerase V